MSLFGDPKQFKNIIKEKNKNNSGEEGSKDYKKGQETPFERTKRAAEINAGANTDEVIFVDDTTVIIKLEPVFLLTNNILIRVGKCAEKGSYFKVLKNRVDTLLRSDERTVDFIENNKGKTFIAESLLDTPQGRVMDFDNLVAGFKPIIDGFEQAEFLKDDNPTFLPFHLPQQRVVKKDEKRNCYVSMSLIESPEKINTPNFRRFKKKVEKGKV